MAAAILCQQALSLPPHPPPSSPPPPRLRPILDWRACSQAMLSHIIQLFVLYHPLFTNTSTFCLHVPDAPTCSKQHPLVAFRRTNNLSNLLVSAKLPNPTHNTPPHGYFLCGDNCLTYNYITDGRTSYTFHSTGETRHITHHIDCNSKNVIYMVHCNRCHKQYIGETKQRLKDRFNEHRIPVDKQTNRFKPSAVSEHFLSNDHNASDMLLIPLELIKSNRDSVRTLYAKLERHTSSIEVKLLNL